MHLPPSGDPRWRDLSAPVLDHLRSLPGGADWAALTAWMRRARWTITRVTNALAWLEGEGLARSTGGREVRPGLDCLVPGRERVREARVGAAEPVRWHAGGPATAPCPVVRGPAPPAALPPLRGTFLAGRRASPPPPARRVDPGSRDPGSRVDGPLRLPSEDRALRAEACAPRVWRGTTRKQVTLPTREPSGPTGPRRPPPEVLREVKLAHHREYERARRERGRELKSKMPPVVPRPGRTKQNVAKSEEARARWAAWLASGPTCSSCGAPLTAELKPGRLPTKCAACRERRVKPSREHPACCGCGECG